MFVLRDYRRGVARDGKGRNTRGLVPEASWRPERGGRCLDSCYGNCNQIDEPKERKGSMHLNGRPWFEPKHPQAGTRFRRRAKEKSHAKTVTVIVWQHW